MTFQLFGGTFFNIFSQMWMFKPGCLNVVAETRLLKRAGFVYRASSRGRTGDLPLTRRMLWPAELKRRIVVLSGGCGDRTHTGFINPDRFQDGNRRQPSVGPSLCIAVVIFCGRVDTKRGKLFELSCAGTHNFSTCSRTGCGEVENGFEPS